MEETKRKVKYVKMGGGIAYKNKNYDPNKKLPMFTGTIDLDDKFLDNMDPQSPIKIAVWRNSYDGKESLGFQLTQEKEG
tara:strand:+ start:2460 stop:2696 length:237 start_codon:yes stop_codon:yes gene_type:complete